MATLTLLGTGAALTAPHRTTTMLAFSDDQGTILVDCGGDVIQRLLASGGSVSDIRALIVTHEHPDHVGGFPLFMEKIWLAGRRVPLPVYGLPEALSQTRRAFETFDTSRWTGLPEIEPHPIELSERAFVLETGSLRIHASPGDHGVPVVGLRVENRLTGGVVAYSCDTRPSPSITRLAEKADILVHEANGQGPGHTSAEEASGVALEAGAGRLVLVHLPPDVPDAELAAARAVFPRVELGEELARYDF